MPYSHTDDLPDQVRDALPKGAQDIYLAAFNSAWEEYSDKTDREETAHRVAWAAVKKQYEKQNGRWVRR